MIYTLVIKGRLPGINEYTAANRTNYHKGAKMKKDAQQIVCGYIRQQLKGVRISKPVWINYKFYELDRRRDHDNVTGFAHKVIQDALVQCEVLKDDGWAEILGDRNAFYVDKQHPRIEIEIIED